MVRVFCYEKDGEIAWAATPDYPIQLSIAEGRMKLMQRGIRLLYCIKVRLK